MLVTSLSTVLLTQPIYVGAWFIKEKPSTSYEAIGHSLGVDPSTVYRTVTVLENRKCGYETVQRSQSTQEIDRSGTFLYHAHSTG